MRWGGREASTCGEHLQRAPWRPRPYRHQHLALSKKKPPLARVIWPDLASHGGGGRDEGASNLLRTLNAQWCTYRADRRTAALC